MPPLPQSRGARSASVGPSPTPSVRPGPLGGLISEVGQGATAIEDALSRKEDEDGRVWAAKTITEARGRYNQAITDAQNSGEDLSGYTPKIKQQLDSDIAAARKAAPSRYGAKYLDIAATDFAVDVTGAAKMAEARYGVTKRVMDAESIINSNQNQVYQDPSLFPKAYAENKSLIDGLSVPIDVKAKLTDQLKNLAVAAIQGQGRSDPSKAMQLLNSGAYNTYLDADRRNTLVSFLDGQIQHRAAMADHAAAVGERNRRIVGDQVAKEGADLLTKGQMTEDWLSQNRAVLDSSDYRMIRHEMQNGGGTDSANTTADLFKRLYVNGEDIGQDTISAMQRGDVSVESAKSLLNENKSTQGIESPTVQGRKYIANSLKVSEINPDPAAAQRLANAMSSFNQQLREDPKQSPDMLAKQIVKQYSLLDFNSFSLVQPLPKFAVGDRQNLDVKASRAATTKAFLEKHGGDINAVKADPDFARELRSLKQWDDQLAKVRSAADAAAKAAK